MAAKTLGLSGRGRHIHSTRPLGAIRQLTSQSERNAYSAIGGDWPRTTTPALLAPPVEGTVDPLGFRDVERDYEVALVAFLREHVVQCLRLAHGARETVQGDALAGLRLGQAAADDVDDELIGYQVAGRHDPAGLLADRRPAGDLRTQDVPCRQMFQPERVLDLRGLRALAAPRRAEDDPDHPRSWILRRRRHQLLAFSASSAAIAGSGPEGSPSSLRASQRRVIST